jgi:hypothetical protein
VWIFGTAGLASPQSPSTGVEENEKPKIDLVETKPRVPVCLLGYGNVTCGTVPDDRGLCRIAGNPNQTR